MFAAHASTETLKNEGFRKNLENHIDRKRKSNKTKRNRLKQPWIMYQMIPKIS